jgi:hypothetical protein
MSFMLINRQDGSKNDGEAANIRNKLLDEVDGWTLLNDLENDMYNVIPETCKWKAVVFRFLNTDLSSIITLLASSGILNSSNPTVMYSIAIRIFKYPFGMNVVWVGVGVIEDLAN